MDAILHAQPAGGGEVIRRLRRLWRNVLVGLGLVLIAAGFVGVLLPTHLLGFLLVLGLILVLRNSIRWRRRFIHMQRRYPRYGHPLRRLLKGEVIPVLWHEALRTERLVGFLLFPRRSRPRSHLRRWRLRRRQKRAAPMADRDR